MMDTQGKSMGRPPENISVQKRMFSSCIARATT